MRRRDLLKALALSATVDSAIGPLRLHAAGGTPAPGATPEADRAALLLVRWELQAITRADDSTVSPDTPANHTIQLLEDGQILVQADCTGGSGAYTLDGASLIIHELVTTLVGCAPGSIGGDFATALGKVEAYVIGTDASDALTLSTTDGATFAFAPGLGGVVWQFVRFQSGRGDEVTVDDPSRCTLEFAGDGTVRVQADCNRGTGTAKVDGESIDLKVALTRAACGPGSLGTEFARYLDDTVSWVIRDGQLHLSLWADAGIASFAPMVPVAEGTPAAPGG